jgi:hypothetical protein
VLSPGERLEYRLTAPIPLPRVPRLPIRKMLSCLPKLVPAPLRRSRAGRLARAHPALAAWAAIFAAFGLAAAAQGLVEPHYRWEPERYQKWLARRGARVVKASLAAMGPAVKLPTVRAEPRHPWILGTYDFTEREISFNSNREYRDFDLLETASHEMVHSVFDQVVTFQEPTEDLDFFLVVNEASASILGAFVVGEVCSWQGYDGSIVTENLVLEYRLACDPNLYGSMYDRHLTPDRVASGDFTHEYWHAVLVHFGTPAPLIDAIYEICYLHSDPTEAARIIAQRFMREDLDPRDQAIFEEFERTRRRWDEAH